jgi:hypothetical protein
MAREQDVDGLSFFAEAGDAGWLRLAARAKGPPMDMEVDRMRYLIHHVNPR